APFCREYVAHGNIFEHSVTTLESRLSNRFLNRNFVLCPTSALHRSAVVYKIFRNSSHGRWSLAYASVDRFGTLVPSCPRRLSQLDRPPVISLNDWVWE